MTSDAVAKCVYSVAVALTRHYQALQDCNRRLPDFFLDNLKTLDKMSTSFVVRRNSYIQMVS